MKSYQLVFYPLLVLAIESLTVTSKNSSYALLKCTPAENFIRMHMAPDFETPRLVRRVDWLQDDSLVASYQQDFLSDSSRQWWVADGRFELIRPFYSLKISPVFPEDSGTYQCRMETDPLFAVPLNVESQELTVLVRPAPPSSPQVKSSTNRSVTLIWSHNVARAHRPILRFSVSVRTISNNARFVMAASSNATTVIVDNLQPYTLYAFAVRAENEAGVSEFGPETNFRTMGIAPTSAPVIKAVGNVSSTCVDVAIEPPVEMMGELEKFILKIRRFNETEARQEIFDKPTSTPLILCGLEPEMKYILTAQVDNGFGYSPSTSTSFFTEPNIPNVSPDTIKTSAVVGKPEINIMWPSSKQTATKYHLYYKTENEVKWNLENLNVQGAKPKMYKYRLTGLEPETVYHIRVSASTHVGEGKQSQESVVKTDIGEPEMVSMNEITFDCKNSVIVGWKYKLKGPRLYVVQISNKTIFETLNVTDNYIKIEDLLWNSEYSVQIAATDRSRINNSLLMGKFSEAHRFVVSDKCHVQSSLCSNDNSKCQKLKKLPIRSNYLSILIVVFAIILFAFICLLILHLARGSFDLKLALMKKKKEKCVYLEEISPLVYDSIGNEEIPVELFYGYVEDLKRNDNLKFRIQFQTLEEKSLNDSSEQDEEKNCRNRYLNISATESTRIRLHNATSCDYINANYIDSCEEKRAYIATQAPLPSTFGDFWSMIWQEKCNIIVCITNLIENGKRKCDQYWPNEENNLLFNRYHISFESEIKNSNFSHRTFMMKLDDSIEPVERKIHHLQFYGWPDHGIPTSVFPLLTFIHYCADIQTTGPIVVHCSAGVGRSGAFILIDSMRRHLIGYRRLNVMEHLSRMRQQRGMLVQTLEQYIFCHEAIRQLIRHGITRVGTDIFMRYLQYLTEENLNGKTRMELQYEDICKCSHKPHCSNRIPTVVKLPGYHRNDEFMVGRWGEECDELWENVWDRNIRTIVYLANDKTSSNRFWRKIDKVSDIRIEHGDNFALIQKAEQQLFVRIVEVFHEDLEFDFWRELENIQKQRLTFHESPLLIIYPCPIHSKYISLSSPDPSTGSLSTLDVSSSINEYQGAYPFVICALTTLACQLELTGCVDIVEVLASYTDLHCGIFVNKKSIETIYERISLLVGGTRV